MCSSDLLIGDRQIPVKIIGIRPGEKMHEIMVSEEEAHHCVRRGSYYAILPMLPELRFSSPQEPADLKREFSSADTVLDLIGTIDLLRQHQLMPENVIDNATELLR